MMGAVSILGYAAVHLLGAALLALASGTSWTQALRRPVSGVVALAVLYLLSLGGLGLAPVAVLVLAGAALRGPQPAFSAFPWRFFGGVAVCVLARPWVPTLWDEYVWLGKARLVSWGFNAQVEAALDVSQRLIPPGYPTLWPSAVGWLALGQDALEAHTVAGTLLVLLAVAVALEAWAPLLLADQRARWASVAVLATPLVWVHLRSTYVDLPLGLLGLALLGQLLRRGDGRPAPEALATAVVLVAFKDEGVAHVLAATAAALVAVGRGRRGWLLFLPAAMALVAVAVWRWRLHVAGVSDVDHALGTPAWAWLPSLGSLLWRHATDVFTWGVFWAVTLAVMTLPSTSEAQRALRVMVLAQLGVIAVELLFGPDRVRAFAENGSLLNRLLLQVWPVAGLAVWARLAQGPSSSSAERAGFL